MDTYKWCELPEFKSAFEKKLRECIEQGLLPERPAYEYGIPPMAAVQGILANAEETNGNSRA
jgi:hypothetical protein